MPNRSDVPRWVRFAGAGVLALTLTTAAWAHGRLVARSDTAGQLTEAGSQVASLSPGTPATAGNAAPDAATPSTPQIISYTVVSGDTLSEIAAKYGTDVSSIMSINDLSRSSSLKIGQTLKILTIKGTIHKVKSGDSLSKIAVSYGVAVDAIAQANGISSDGTLAIGKELIVPGAKPVVASTSRGGTTRPSTPSTGKSGGTSGTQPKSGSYLWPVSGPVTSGFGSRWGSEHTGIDIGVPSGTAVHAAKAGTVVKAGWDGGYGYRVVIDHGGGVETLYAHNSKLLVSEGDHVDAGQTIARSGNTGHSTGPHVHFEVQVNGKAKNPKAYLK